MTDIIVSVVGTSRDNVHTLRPYGRASNVVAAARRTADAVRSIGGGEGGSNWFFELAELLKAVDDLDAAEKK